MKYAILGDIHGNLTALHAVLAQIDDQGVDCLISVGDVVGYGPAPAECIRVLQQREAIVVKGNHDAACVGELDDQFFNNYARQAVRWTRGVLTRSELKWLRQLPMTRHLDHCEVSHGSLFQPQHYTYVSSPTDASPSLDVMRTPVCFVGHTHIPVILTRAKNARSGASYRSGNSVNLGEVGRTLVNVGSVGQPRDEDPRTGYAIFDAEQLSVCIHRVEYDIDTEARLSAKAGLPRVLGDRLYLGV